MAAEEDFARIEPWELELVRQVAHQFRTEDPEGLETELVGKLKELKSRPPGGVQSWRDYLWISLRNHAANFTRHMPPIKKIPINTVESGEEDAGEDPLLGVILTSLEDDLDSKIAFADAWKELRPDQRELLRVLDEERWNQVAAAKRLHKHRNTIRNWLGEIRQVLQRHGLP